MRSTEGKGTQAREMLEAIVLAFIRLPERVAEVEER
jgi:hypothetical protein